MYIFIEDVENFRSVNFVDYAVDYVVDYVVLLSANC